MWLLGVMDGTLSISKGRLFGVITQILPSGISRATPIFCTMDQQPTYYCGEDVSRLKVCDISHLNTIDLYAFEHSELDVYETYLIKLDLPTVNHYDNSLRSKLCSESNHFSVRYHNFFLSAFAKFPNNHLAFSLRHVASLDDRESNVLFDLLEWC